MKERRSELEIYRDILKVIESTAKPTWIMYKARLSWLTMMRHLKELMKLGLIEEIQVKTKAGTRKRYKLTPKGKKILTSLNEALRLFEETSG